MTEGQLCILTGVLLMVVGVAMAGFPGAYPILVGMFAVTIGDYLHRDENRNVVDSLWKVREVLRNRASPWR